MSILQLVAPVVSGTGFVAVMSLVRDPDTRLRLNAMITIGASGTYLSGGAFEPWELLAPTWRRARGPGRCAATTQPRLLRRVPVAGRPRSATALEG